MTSDVVVSYARRDKFIGSRGYDPAYIEVMMID